MAREIKVEAAILNIKAHPNSRQTYADILQAVMDYRIIGRVHGDRHGMIMMIDQSALNDGLLFGTVMTFVDIEIDGSWFNTATLSEAGNNEISSINIPDHLRPNLASFYFLFDLDKHKLYFQTYSGGKQLTPLSAKRLFDNFFEDVRMIKEFGDIKVNIVQGRAGMDELFSIDIVKKATFIIERPNTDILQPDFEKRIERHLGESGSRSMVFEYIAERGGSVERTDDLDMLGRTALMNGEIKVTGRDDGSAVELSSRKFPKKFHGKYDPDLTTESDAFREILDLTEIYQSEERDDA